MSSTYYGSMAGEEADRGGEPGVACDSTAADGQWLCISFMGHLEYTGYVTEITKHGQAAYRIDLPEKLWGGNPLAYVIQSAASWFGEHPVTEEAVRASWERTQEWKRERAREQAEWEAEQRRAIEPGGPGGEPF